MLALEKPVVLNKTNIDFPKIPELKELAGKVAAEVIMRSILHNELIKIQLNEEHRIIIGKNIRDSLKWAVGEMLREDNPLQYSLDLRHRTHEILTSDRAREGKYYQKEYWGMLVGLCCLGLTLMFMLGPGIYLVRTTLTTANIPGIAAYIFMFCSLYWCFLGNCHKLPLTIFELAPLSECQLALLKIIKNIVLAENEAEKNSSNTKLNALAEILSWRENVFRRGLFREVLSRFHLVLPELNLQSFKDSLIGVELPSINIKVPVADENRREVRMSSSGLAIGSEPTAVLTTNDSESKVKISKKHPMLSWINPNDETKDESELLLQAGSSARLGYNSV
jgi:hypothetical protein